MNAPPGMNARQAAFHARMEAVRQAAHGRWTELLIALGVSETILNRKNQPCPIDGCGGTDRFQYTDRHGHGNYHCRSCGAGGGFKLLQAVRALSAADALRELEGQLALLPPASPVGKRDDNWAARMAGRILAGARPIRRGDAVDRYLRGRGLALDGFPDSLLMHPQLEYFEDNGSGKKVVAGRYPAMLAKVTLRGQLVALQRTYVHDGAKAPVPEPKKSVVLSSEPGGAVWLAPPGPVTIAVEGVESGLAEWLEHGLPVACGLSAQALEQLWLPESVEFLSIHGDNDSHSAFAGQCAAYALARRCVTDKARRRRAQVYIPPEPGADPLTEYLASMHGSAMAPGATRAAVPALLASGGPGA